MAKMLPIDIIRDILVRLPVKTLLRFRCVSKDWRSLITDSFFITLHHNRSKGEWENPSLIVTDGKSLYSVENSSCHKIDLPFYISTKLRDCHHYCNREIVVVGSCNGLLCFSIRILRMLPNCNPIFLCNPATRQFKALPYPPRALLYPPREKLVGIRTRIGFGFDPMSNDYKVVMIVYYDVHANEYGSLIMPSDVWIYSLNSDNWRKLGDIPVPDVSYAHSKLPPDVNAAIHWMTREGSIFCFDLVQELFREIPPPPGNGIYKDVVVIGGYLSVFHNFRSYSTNSCEMWVMKEYGEKESWTKHLIVISGNPSSYRPVDFWNDEILFQRHGKKPVFYNTKGNAERKTEIHGLPNQSIAFISYTKSLVMLEEGTIRVEGKRRRRRSDVEFCCFVGGLAWWTDGQDLEWEFSLYGEIIESKIITDRGRSRGFGFVTFCDEQSMRDAIQGMNGQDLDGRNIIVEQAHTRQGSIHGGGYQSGDGDGYGRHDNSGAYSRGADHGYKDGRQAHTRGGSSGGGGYRSGNGGGCGPREGEGGGGYSHYGDHGYRDGGSRRN